MEYEACVGAGLDLWKWESGLYSNWFMAKTMAWWEGHELVKQHTEDAVNA